MEITHDAFLNGQVVVKQPKKGYRAGVDAVLLAASVPAKAGQKVLDVGCGVGTASLCLNARVSDLLIQGIDCQPFLIELAQKNAESWKNMHFYCERLESEKRLEKNIFDHVITNPPYFRKGETTLSPDAIKDKANFETIELATWLQLCLKYVKPFGTLSLIHCADRLDDILLAINIKKRSLKIIPIWPRLDFPAKRVIVQITKDKRAPLLLLPGLVLHGEEHYTLEAQKILREGQALNC